MVRVALVGTYDTKGPEYRFVQRTLASAGVESLTVDVGILIAACFPRALAVAVDPGWMLLVWVCLLYLGVELVVAYLLEPWVYAASTGLSPVALDNGGDFLDPAMGADRVTFVDSPNSLSRGTRSSRAAARVSRVVARRHAGSCTR